MKLDSARAETIKAAAKAAGVAISPEEWRALKSGVVPEAFYAKAVATLFEAREQFSKAAEAMQQETPLSSGFERPMEDKANAYASTQAGQARAEELANMLWKDIPRERRMAIIDAAAQHRLALAAADR